MKTFEKELEELFILNNHRKKNFVQRFFEILKNISAIRILSVEEKNFLFTQKVIELISVQRLKGENVNSVDLNKVLDSLERFLETSLVGRGVEKHARLLFNEELKLDEKTEFREFLVLAEKLLQQNKKEKKDIIKEAKILKDTVYPLTKKYFLSRYLAEAIICEGCVSDTESLSSPKSYENEKKLCLDFLSRISVFRECDEVLQNANKNFDSERKYVARSLDISNIVRDHSIKIAFSFVVYTAAITVARYNMSEDSKWYENLAWPSTLLAMIQIFASFPQIIFSSIKARENSNYMFEHFKNVNKIREIQFLDRTIPSFSNNKISTVSSGFRWLGNLMLQPIGLIHSDMKDLILRWGPMRFFTSTGVIEEQDKVAFFVSNELRKFLYTNIVPALLDDRQIVADRYIKRFFYLLYKQIGKNETEEQRLKKIYITLTGDESESVDFENIISNEEKRRISKYLIWSKATFFAGVLTLIAEYTCFALRKENILWYKNPMFYASTPVKFMRLFSLLASTYCCANWITESFTDDKLTNNIYFQDFLYNDAARMVSAIVPLVIFEFTHDIKILGIATALDVLTTVGTDMNCGKDMSVVSKLSTEKLIVKLQCAQKIPSQTESNSQQLLYAQGAQNQTNQQKESDTQASNAQSSATKTKSSSDLSYVEIEVHPTLSSSHPTRLATKEMHRNSWHL